MNKDEIVIEKLKNIAQIINDIKEYDQPLADLIWMGFDTSMSLAKSVYENSEKDEPIDISVYLEQMCEVLGINLEQLILDIVQKNNTNEVAEKEPDTETLDFITSDMDDYEKFLAKNSAKNNLDFLSKEI
jgi:hypothetical protein